MVKAGRRLHFANLVNSPLSFLHQLFLSNLTLSSCFCRPNWCTSLSKITNVNTGQQFCVWCLLRKDTPATRLPDIKMSCESVFNHKSLISISSASTNASTAKCFPPHKPQSLRSKYLYLLLFSVNQKIGSSRAYHETFCSYCSTTHYGLCA